MEKQRLSFDMEVEDHKYLKMCCAKLGISIKDFIIKATNEKVESYEDEWLFKDSYEEYEKGNLEFIPFETALKELEICV
jgi:hypothetical protein